MPKQHIQVSRRHVLIAVFISVPALLVVLGTILFFMGPDVSEGALEYQISRLAGSAEVFSPRTGRPAEITRKTQKEIVLYPRDRLKVSKDSDLDLKIPDVIDLRLKPSTEIELSGVKRGLIGRMFKLKLLQGSIFGFTREKFAGRELDIKTPHLLAAIQGASFLVQMGAGNQSTTVSILEGKAKVRPLDSKQSQELKALETITVKAGEKEIPAPRRVQYQEWKTLSEVHELKGKTAKEEAGQEDLRKKAGSLFKYVFDEGVFFKPGWGFAEREFYQEVGTGQVMLKISFDVFPQNSYSGMYFKIRGLDLSKVKRFKLSLKADAAKPIPDQFRIEFKDQFSIVRGFAVKPITKDWREYAFDFNAKTPAPVDEMVFVFENTRVGPLKTNGMLYLKELVIE